MFYSRRSVGDRWGAVGGAAGASCCCCGSIALQGRLPLFASHRDCCGDPQSLRQTQPLKLVSELFAAAPCTLLPGCRATAVSSQAFPSRLVRCVSQIEYCFGLGCLVRPPSTQQTRPHATAIASRPAQPLAPAPCPAPPPPCRPLPPPHHLLPFAHLCRPPLAYITRRHGPQEDPGVRQQAAAQGAHSAGGGAGAAHQRGAGQGGHQLCGAGGGWVLL